jgi:hypothetical protein
LAYACHGESLVADALDFIDAHRFGKRMAGSVAAAAA